MMEGATLIKTDDLLRNGHNTFGACRSQIREGHKIGVSHVCIAFNNVTIITLKKFQKSLQKGISF